MLFDIEWIAIPQKVIIYGFPGDGFILSAAFPEKL